MSRLANSLVTTAIFTAIAYLPAAVSARSPDANDPKTLLALPVTLRCDAVPLVRALRQLREQTGTVIVFESALLERARIRPTMRVSVYCREARLDRALDLLLGPCRLAHEVRDGAIWVFPDYDWYAALTRETYDVRDLQWKPPGARVDATGYEEIVEFLTSICSPASWGMVGGRGEIAEWNDVFRAIVGGPGEMTAHDGALRILQSPRVHAELADTLGELRRVRTARPGQEASVWNDAPMRRRMTQPISWSFDDLALGQFAARLSALAECDVAINWNALEEADIPTDVRVSGSTSGLPLGDALTGCLAVAKLGWIERHDAILITSQDEVHVDLTSRFYNVRDLTRREARGLGTIHDCNELIELTTSLIAGESWDEVGGPGSVRDFDGLLCVSQTDENHQNIAAQFALLRRFQSGENEPVEALSGPSYDPFNEVLVTRFYDLRDLAELRGVHRVTPWAAKHVLMETIESQSWDEVGGPGSIWIYARLLVVSQTLAVHQRIEGLFEQLRERIGL